MIKKVASKSDGFLKNIIREEIKEAFDSQNLKLDEKFQDFKSDMLFALDKTKSSILDAVDQRNFQARSDLATMKDEVVGEIKDMREEYEIMKSRHEQILEHDDKIEKLERIHPLGQHAVVHL